MKLVQGPVGLVPSKELYDEAVGLANRLGVEPGVVFWAAWELGKAEAYGVLEISMPVSVPLLPEELLIPAHAPPAPPRPVHIGGLEVDDLRMPEKVWQEIQGLAIASDRSLTICLVQAYVATRDRLFAAKRR